MAGQIWTPGDPAGPVCRMCGCDDEHACWDDVLEEPCHWAQCGDRAPDLCSVCARVEAMTEVMIARSASLDDCRDGPRILGPDGRPWGG
jgi:hypothetical protein